MYTEDSAEALSLRGLNCQEANVTTLDDLKEQADKNTIRVLEELKEYALNILDNLSLLEEKSNKIINYTKILQESKVNQERAKLLYYALSEEEKASFAEFSTNYLDLQKKLIFVNNSKIGITIPADLEQDISLILGHESEIIEFIANFYPQIIYLANKFYTERQGGMVSYE